MSNNLESTLPAAETQKSSQNTDQQIDNYKWISLRYNVEKQVDVHNEHSVNYNPT